MSFDCEGIGFARQALKALATSPVTNSRSGLSQKVIKELYTEIRAARIAGHSWNSIRKSIIGSMKISISAPAIKKHFVTLDYQYAAETGVSPIEPPLNRPKGQLGRPRKGE